MIGLLRQREEEGRRIRVGLAGAGAMGRGIAMQVSRTPGMELAWVADLEKGAAEHASQLGGDCAFSTNVTGLFDRCQIDVFVEATNSIAAAADYCQRALEHGAHVVLMNAEVDLAVGPALARLAEEKGLVLTSDAGDQHGVLATMIDEAELLGFQVIQAGNIKGFLDRSATPESIKPEADKRNLSATQCCAYTDGTKLHIEMAVLANGYGYLPPKGGMTGPRAETVQEALGAFDFPSYDGQARIDYILGAEPGGGVYLVVRAPEGMPDEHAFFLNYYKLGNGPYYLMYRPYHLCHLETPRAIAQAVLRREAVLRPAHGRKTDVYAFAKRDLQAGESLRHAIGSAECYGLCHEAETADSEGMVPIVLLEGEVRVTSPIAAGQALRFSDVALPESAFLELWRSQV